MLRRIGSRRGPRYGAQVCAIIAALLLLVSVSVLHSRLSFDGPSQQQQKSAFTSDFSDDIDAIVANPLLEDDGGGLAATNHNTDDDRIDELDVIQEEEEENDKLSNEEEILRGVEVEDDLDLDGGVGGNRKTKKKKKKRRPSGYYYDHVVGVIRRAFNKQSTDPWGEQDFSLIYSSSSSSSDDPSKVAFGSDDEPVDEDVRRKLDGIRGIEDALLLKSRKVKVSVSQMREGWANWFEKKGDFLRRDRMFKSNLELLNPLNNPLLQDPDGIGLASLTRGDKLIQKALLLNHFQKSTTTATTTTNNVKGVELRRTLHENTSINTSADVVQLSTNTHASHDGTKDVNLSNGSSTPNLRQQRLSSDHNNSSWTDQPKNFNDTSTVDQLGDSSKNMRSVGDANSGDIIADGKRWGYFPGLHPHLSFSDFIEEFFSKGKCLMKVFMVWNSPPWMYTVRHQRGLESLLHHHPDACVMVFSETIDLDFFKNFVKDGFKVAVAMPNLDELLKDTPTHVFASIWFEWRKTNFYPVHYSELVRLAALYKYGGLYLDSDILVLKSLSSLNNSVGSEDQMAERSPNGAVMAFGKNSLFIKECLKEFYSTYDDTLLRWNGAELLTRMANRLLSGDNELMLKIQPPSTFFPIARNDIARYFAAPANDTERDHQDILITKILDESYTFHFWNSLTSTLVPEAGSLVAKLLDLHCIHCFDVL